MSKNDVWRELMERLKQKASQLDDIFYSNLQAFNQWSQSPVGAYPELTKRFKEKWVRLEDVKEAINQLKQKYSLKFVPKGSPPIKVIKCPVIECRFNKNGCWCKLIELRINREGKCASFEPKEELLRKNEG